MISVPKKTPDKSLRYGLAYMVEWQTVTHKDDWVVIQKVFIEKVNARSDGDVHVSWRAAGKLHHLGKSGSLWLFNKRLWPKSRQNIYFAQIPVEKKFIRGIKEGAFKASEVSDMATKQQKLNWPPKHPTKKANAKQKTHKKKAEKPTYKATIRRKAGNAKKHRGKVTLPGGIVVNVSVKKDVRKQRKNRQKGKK